MTTTERFEDLNTQQAPTDFPVLSNSLSHTSQSGPRHPTREKEAHRDLEGGGDDSGESSDEDKEPVEYPEGGKEAWTVVFGSFVSMVASFGIMNTLGTLHAHLSADQLRNNTESEIGWIFGVYSFLSFFGGIQIGPIFDAFGPRWLLVAGTFCIVVGLMLTSVSVGKYKISYSPRNK